MKSQGFIFLPLAVTVLLAGPLFPAFADTFGSGENSFEIEFVTIGDPHNPGDLVGNPAGVGSVDRVFRMAKHEISQEMIRKANLPGGFQRFNGHWGNLRAPEFPAYAVNWFEAAQYVNWLNTSTGNQPAYKFDGGGKFQLWQPSDPGFNPDNLFRNDLAKYFLPSTDEWHKAAYYDPASGTYFTYATGSNTLPTVVASGTEPNTAIFGKVFSVTHGIYASIYQAGGLSPYGTMAQNGNVAEWQETEQDGVNDSAASDWTSIRVFRGGELFGQGHLFESDDRRYGLPEKHYAGFRVASVVPEPASLLVLIGGLGVLAGGPLGRIVRRIRQAGC